MTDIGGETLNEIRDQSITGTVDVDGTHFINCTFPDTRLRYGGGALPRFENCTADNVSWYFRDAALRTIQLLQSQNLDGRGQAMLDKLFRAGSFLNA